MGHLYALDFDGVLCDSCGESSISALKVSPFTSPPSASGHVSIESPQRIRVAVLEPGGVLNFVGFSDDEVIS